MAIIRFDSLASTSRYLRHHHHRLRHFDVVTCDEQTEGKGRGANTWYADRHSLVFSMLLKHVPDRAAVRLLPFFAADILHRTLSEIARDVTVKWPNDIYLGDKKIAGILLQRFEDGARTHVIIGIGINLNNPSFPKKLPDASSLFLETGKTHDRELLLSTLAERMEKRYASFLQHPEAAIDHINHHAYLNGRPITCLHQGKTVSGTCLKTDDSGCLIIRQTDGTTVRIPSTDTRSIHIKNTRTD